jgi:hypothetical protein
MRNPDGRIREHGGQRPGSLCRPAARNHLHLGRFAAESGKALRRFNANEHPHRFAKQISLVHSGIGYVQRPLIEFVIDGDGGSQEKVLVRINSDVFYHQLRHRQLWDFLLRMPRFAESGTRDVPVIVMRLIYIWVRPGVGVIFALPGEGC